MQAQLAHLRHFNLQTGSTSACVPPALVLSEADDAAVLPRDVSVMLQFVKAVTGVHSDVGARVCLNRVLAAMYRAAVAAHAANASADDSDDTSGRNRPAYHYLQQYLDVERGLLKVAADREGSVVVPPAGGVTDAPLSRVDVCVPHPSESCAFPATGASSCGLCVSCGDIAASVLYKQTFMI